MLCNLSEIASALAQTYSIETYGMMEVPVRSICRITPATPFASAVETLYVGTPSDLEAMRSNQNLTAFPFLCIADQHPQEWNRYPYTSMKTIVLVHNQLLGDVLARLAEIMFQLGQQSAPTPPLYHTLLGCQNPGSHAQCRCGEHESACSAAESGQSGASCRNGPTHCHVPQKTEGPMSILSQRLRATLQLGSRGHAGYRRRKGAACSGRGPSNLLLSNRGFQGP